MRILPAALLLVTASAATGQDEPSQSLTKALAGRVAGKPVNCITLEPSAGPTIYDRRTIVYQRIGRRMYVTHPVGACPRLRPSATLIVEVRGGQLCRNDRFRVLEPGDIIPSGYCRLDRFTPYTRAPS